MTLELIREIRWDTIAKKFVMRKSSGKKIEVPIPSQDKVYGSWSSPADSSTAYTSGASHAVVGLVEDVAVGTEFGVTPNAGGDHIAVPPGIWSASTVVQFDGAITGALVTITASGAVVPYDSGSPTYQPASPGSHSVVMPPMIFVMEDAGYIRFASQAYVASGSVHLDLFGVDLVKLA